MGDRTGIEWTDATWNPVRGCARVSPGCEHCYAEAIADRFSGPGQPWADGYIQLSKKGEPRWSGKVTFLPHKLDEPRRWKRAKRIFVNSMSDLFHRDITDEQIQAIFTVMRECPWHQFQILTKRPERLAKLTIDWPSNVWMGVSIESADYLGRADLLSQCGAAIKFLSLEPLLGPLPKLDLTGIDWVIVGGESGPGARPMDADWVREIRDQVVRAGVALHFKQWGGVRKKLTGRVLDDRTWDEYPVEANMPKSEMPQVQIPDGAELVEVEIEPLLADVSAQFRLTYDDDAIVDLAEAFQSGAAVPPISIVHDGHQDQVAEGFHRLFGAQRAGLTTIWAFRYRNVIALRLGLALNLDNKTVRVTRADKRNAVKLYLHHEQLGQLSNREIAAECKVDESTVRAIIAELGLRESRSLLPASRPKKAKLSLVPPPPPTIEERIREATVTVGAQLEALSQTPSASVAPREPIITPAPPIPSPIPPAPSVGGEPPLTEDQIKAIIGQGIETLKAEQARMLATLRETIEGMASVILDTAVRLACYTPTELEALRAHALSTGATEPEDLPPLEARVLAERVTSLLLQYPGVDRRTVGLILREHGEELDPTSN